MENATLCTPQKKPTGMDDHDWNDGGFLQVQVCGAPVISSTRNKVSEYLIGYLKKPFDCCRNLFFLNAHGMSFLFAHPTFAEALEDASWILNDGLGMDMAAWLMGRRFQENLNGSDLVDEGPLLAACATEGIGVYILGGHQVVVERAALVYKQRFPGLRIVGVHHGYFAHDSGEASADIVARVNESGAELLLVGMGNPVQEVWLARHRDQLRCKLAIGVGGSIDQVAGHVPRAPAIWIRCRLEWLFRLCQEPERLWRRYLVGGPVFLIRVLLRRPSLYRGGTGASSCK